MGYTLLKIRKMKKILILSLAGAFVFASCKKDKTDEPTTAGTAPVSEYTLLKKDTTANDLVVELHAKTETIDVGYAKLYVKVKNFAGDAIENATLTFMPAMHIGNLLHSTPIEQHLFNSNTIMYQ